MNKVTRKLVSVVVAVVLISTVVGFREAKALTNLIHPVHTIDTTKVGYNIQRTMHLLETSTAENRNRVKIAFYGQSISDANNTWPVKLTDYLRQRYPYANIEYTNLAIGGYTSENLSTMVADDMKGLYPDLVILYDKGSNVLYEKIVRFIKNSTNADVMVQTHHYTKPDLLSKSNSYEFLPALSTKYKAELCQIRTPWKEYIDNYYPGKPEDLTIDGTHLNDLGQEFMFEIMKQYFVYKAPASTWKSPVIDLAVGTDVKWNGGKLEIPFEGNRVELIAGDGISGSLNVKVDNKKPSEILGCYSNPRIWEAGGIWGGKGHLMRAVMLKTPSDQNWTFKYTAYSTSDGRTSFKYQVNGSAAGLDGNGNSDETFISKSGQWAIFPTNFCFFTEPVPNVTQYTWKPILNGTDVYQSQESDNIVLLASGLLNGKHTLTLTAADSLNPPAIKAIRVYKPTLITGSLSKPTVKSVSTESYFVSGKTLPDAMVLVSYNSKQHITEADSAGNYTLDVNALKPGNTIKIKALFSGQYSPETIIKVQPLRPTVSNIKTSSKYFTGSTYKGAKVYITAGGKTKSIMVNTKGKFSLRVWNKLKKNAKIQVWISINGVKSSKKTITVK